MPGWFLSYTAATTGISWNLSGSSPINTKQKKKKGSTLKSEETNMNPVEVVKGRYDAIKAMDAALFFVIAKSGNKNTLAYSYDATSIVRP